MCVQVFINLKEGFTDRFRACVVATKMFYQQLIKIECDILLSFLVTTMRFKDGVFAPLLNMDAQVHPRLLI